MTTTHAMINWFAGDDWEIRATLLDENGAPYDLGVGSPVIKWSLTTCAGKLVLDEADAIIVIVDAAAGICSIVIPAIKTSPLPGGEYTDYIRIETGGVTSTLATGVVAVQADPWIAQPVAVQANRPRLVS